MCLSTITARRTGKNKAVTKVWKWFRVTPDRRELRSAYFPSLYSASFYSGGYGIWLKAAKCPYLLAGVGGYYPRGYHGYKDKAKRNLVAYPRLVQIPVEFRYIHTVGTQWHRSSNKIVFVASEMKIPADWKKYL